MFKKSVDNPCYAGEDFADILEREAKRSAEREKRRIDNLKCIYHHPPHDQEECAATDDDCNCYYETSCTCYYAGKDFATSWRTLGDIIEREEQRAAEREKRRIDNRKCIYHHPPHDPEECAATDDDCGCYYETSCTCSYRK